jgi:DNA polymerase I
LPKRGLLHRDERLQVKKREPAGNISSVNVLVARTTEEIDFAYERLNAASVLGCDTETSSLNPRYGKLFSIQFSDGEFNVLVPLSENVPLGRLIEILADERIIKIFHNAKFDLEFLNAIDIAVQNVFDTMLAERVLTRGANQSASLAETLYRYFAVDLEKSHRTKFNRSWDGVWTDELVEYALSDVAHLPSLMLEQQAWMEKLGLSEEYARQIGKLSASF